MEANAEALSESRRANGRGSVDKDQRHAGPAVHISQWRAGALAGARHRSIHEQLERSAPPRLRRIDAAQSVRIDPAHRRTWLRRLRALAISECAGASRRSRTALAIRVALRRCESVSR